MESIYKYRYLNVWPFLIVPNQSTNQEQYMVIGDSETHEYRNELISKIIDLGSNFLCPLVVIVVWYRGKLIIANSFLSDLECPRSGRKGLRVIYGAAINPLIFFEFEKVCSVTFNLFNVFLSEEFKANPMLDDYNSVLTRFQNEMSDEQENFKTSALNQFLRTLESIFFFEKKRINIFILIKLFKLRSLKIAKPCFNQIVAQRFWETIDKLNCATCKTAQDPIV